MAPTDEDGHEQVNLDNVANLTIKDGQLYWKKEKLKTETRQRLVLSIPQKIGTVIFSISVSLAAILTPIGQYIADMEKICPNTSYSAPFCENWKARHDAEELKAKNPAEKLGTANPDMKATPEAPLETSVPVRTQAPTAP